MNNINNDFGEFQLDGFPQNSQHLQNSLNKQEQLSLSELQKIYKKSTLKKEKKEVDQISNFNKMSQQNNNKNVGQNMPTTIQSHSLLMESQMSFKTVSKIHTQISSIAHIVLILIGLIIKQMQLYLFVSYALQIASIVLNIYHFVQNKNTVLLKNRSQFLIIQIVMLVLADLISVNVLWNTNFILYLVLIYAIDIIFANRLRMLYLIQKSMDIKITHNQSICNQSLADTDQIMS